MAPVGAILPGVPIQQWVIGILDPHKLRFQILVSDLVRSLRSYAHRKKSAAVRNRDRDGLDMLKQEAKTV
jgi:hypothetical protein